MELWKGRNQTILFSALKKILPPFQPNCILYLVPLKRLSIIMYKGLEKNVLKIPNMKKCNISIQDCQMNKISRHLAETI